MNPWLVENLQDFVFLNCPECSFKDKEEDRFQEHALKNHPKSSAFFKASKEIRFIRKETETTIETIIDNATIVEAAALPIAHLDQNSQIQYFINVVDENNQPRQEEILIKHEPIIKDDNDIITNTFPATRVGSARKQTKKSVQALINVLDELSDDQYKCSICPERKFRTADLMRKHYLAEHADEDGNILCQFCDKRCTNLKKFHQHLKSVHCEKQKKSCKICGLVMIENSLKRHMQNVHGDRSKKNFKCDLCDFATHSRHFLGNHKSNNHTLVSVINEETQKVEKKWIADKKESMMPHNITCTRDNCGKVFRSKQALQSHVQSLHDTGLFMYESYSCDKCESVFASPHSYLAHTQEDHNYIPTLLQPHTKHQCSMCSKFYLSSHRLAHHRSRDHDLKGRKPFKTVLKRTKTCEYCGKIFKNPNNHKEHVNVVHEGNTPWSCTYCSRKFGSRKMMESHVATVHTKVTCDICGQLQYNSFYLKRHKTAIHGVVPAGSLKCRFCDLWYQSKTNLDRHVETKHKN